jgi:hypothetical protein
MSVDVILLIAALIAVILSFVESRWPLVQIAVILVIISLLI